MACLIQSLQGSELVRLNVLVNLEKVGWIVFALNLYESVIVVAISRFDSIGSFVHHEVHIAPRDYRDGRLPNNLLSIWLFFRRWMARDRLPL